MVLANGSKLDPYAIQPPLGPAIRYTLAPDCKSFVDSIAKPESSIWMLQGFNGK